MPEEAGEGGRGGFVQVQSPMVGKAQQWQQETVGHTESLVGKQRAMNAGAQLMVFPVLSRTPPPTGQCCPRLGWVLLPQLNLWNHSYRHTEGVSMVILNSVLLVSSYRQHDTTWSLLRGHNLN